IGRGENDKFNAEGGDDIMYGGTGLGDRYIGSSGYDWAIFKGDAFGVTIDLNNRFFDQPPVPGSGASALARFDAVEGLSASGQADFLQGDNVDAVAIAVAGAQGSVLTNFDLISGLRAFAAIRTAGPDGIAGNADDTSPSAGPDGISGNADDRFDGGNII